MLLFTTIRDYMYQILGLGQHQHQQNRDHLNYELLQTPKQQKNFQWMQILIMGQLLALNACYLPAESFMRQKEMFVRLPDESAPDKSITTKNGDQDQDNEESADGPAASAPLAGLLHQKIPSMSLSQFTDPTQMMGMMKTQMMNMVPNLAMWGIVSQFFSGYIVAKFPFSLTSTFRSMVQRGIEHLQLDVSYVTSASLYFLILFGLQGVTYLLRGDKAVNASNQMMQQQSMGMMGGAGGSAADVHMPHPQQQVPDMAKAFQAQIDNLNMVQYKFRLEDEEDKLLERLERRFGKENK
uniref:ER membrane protein complex subunit 3 n=1 Tax=Percolomonas cosmopolitus TaxID=63605 RepID=A0A7S1KQI9_9EUKA|eukprot:CAMPEP_0117447942 /NCGR_PEP_ID=MMETSP0759-20121206/7137_1 /TAXON_ID=63605 /ORGANISM="Percolomonas cosmopolitus, Strain WS" /LENGTH=295 /DNA_ID=CAMNT_0005240297 /DNA_START=96 /DNA_END=983 /DNA_ORIENTATION=+